MTVAHVVHQLPGRLRLRIPEHRKDEAFFDSLAGRLREIEDIISVSRDALTASLLIHHQVPEDRIWSFLEELLELTLQPAPATATAYSLSSVGAGIQAVNHSLQRASGGATDLRTLLFLLLVGLAIRQILRGQIMIPATGLLWNAFELALRYKPEE